jgi:Fe-S cluster biogenesis protein NfuA
MTTPVHVTAEPVDAHRCKFILDRAVHARGVRQFTSAAEAGDSPVAQAILEVPGICEVVVSGNVVTAVQDGTRPWDALEAQIRYAIEAAARQPVSPAPPVAPASLSDDDLFDVVSEIFDAEINPVVAQHGGKVELIDVQDATVVVRMMGGCQGCGMANVTLRQGIEAALRRQFPSLRGIRDITDHSAGTNPYFTAGTK